MHTLSPWKTTAAIVAGVVTIQALMLFAFAWPATNTGPREVPIAVAGPSAATEQVESALRAVPGADDGTPAFDVVAVQDDAAAVAAIEDRDAYGAVVVTPDGPRLLVATAAGAAVAQMLRAVAAELSPDAPPPPIDDVVPADADDPNGAALGAGILPLVMTSAAAGLLAAVVLRTARTRLTAVAGVAIAGGLAAAAILQYGLGAVGGAYLALAGVLALLIAAAAGSVAGLGAVLGRAGAGLGVLLMILLGNPLSAAASAPELLPQPWGDLGQLMPPSAGVSAVRSVAFFDGAGAGRPLLVLAVWALAGAALIAAGMLRRTPASDRDRQPVPIA